MAPVFGTRSYVYVTMATQCVCLFPQTLRCVWECVLPDMGSLAMQRMLGRGMTINCCRVSCSREDGVGVDWTEKNIHYIINWEMVDMNVFENKHLFQAYLRMKLNSIIFEPC